MNYQIGFALFLLIVLAICGGAIAGEWLAARLIARRRRIANARLNDCKPGCFMTVGKQEDLL